jgi:hypothetical protein
MELKMHKCERCAKEFKQSSDLKRHMNRKRPCREIIKQIPKRKSKKKVVVHELPQYVCAFCGVKRFRHYQSRWRHEKICRVRQEHEAVQLKKEKDDWLKEKEHMKRQIEVLLDVATQSRVTHITNNNTYNVVNINSFGNEDTSYVRDGFMRRLLKSQQPSVAVPQLLKHIHFNPDHPENCNIKITNRKERFAQIFSNEKWTLAKKKDVLHKMLHNGYTLLDSCFEDADKKGIDERRRARYERFQEQMDDLESATRRKVSEDIELLVLNNS